MVRAIRDLAHVAPQARRTAIFVMPRAVVPPEMS
jgi:hypothetical protein